MSGIFQCVPLRGMIAEDMNAVLEGFSLDLDLRETMTLEMAVLLEKSPLAVNALEEAPIFSATRSYARRKRREVPAAYPTCAGARAESAEVVVRRDRHGGGSKPGAVAYPLSIATEESSLGFLLGDVHDRLTEPHIDPSTARILSHQPGLDKI